MRWTVNRRIGVGFGIGLALMALIAAVGVLALRDATEQHRRAQYEQRMSMYAVDVQNHFQTSTLNFLRYLLLPGQAEWVERYDGAYLAAVRDAGVLRDSSSAAESRRAWGEVHGQLEEWRERTRQAVATARAGRADEAIRQWDAEVRANSVQIERTVAERIRAEDARRDVALAGAAAAADRNIGILVGGAALALLVGLLSARQLSRAVTGPLNRTTGTLASSASEILAATTQQASSASQTAAAVAETAATIDEVAQTAEQSAERARAVADTAQRVAEISRTGSAAVEASIESMDQVREQVESIAASILALADQAQAIGEIIATVDEISGQTNLLALNASIEASRAGEYGRGFAVVAGEIRSLADQSKRATVQVRQILGEIQRATGAAVMTTEEGTKQVAAGSKQVTRAGQTIRDLSQTVSEAAHSAVQIAASSSQQAVGMAQLRQAMTQIQEASHQNLSAVQQTERAATDLNHLGSALLQLVSGTPRAGRRG